LIDNPALLIAMILWIFFIPNAVKLFYRFVRNNKQFIEKDLRRIPNDQKIIFQITTKSATKTRVVERGIQSIIDSCKSTKYGKYEILIVTEDPKDIKTLESMPCKVRCVEKGSSPNAIKKARALQFAIESRRKLKKQNSDHWNLNIKNERYKVQQIILYILKYIK